MAVRFLMVKRSLQAGKPSEPRRKTLYGEFWICSIAGIFIFLVGITSPYYLLSVDHAKVIANSGGVLFGLGIPQYIQYYYSKDDQKYIKSQKHLNNYAWGLFIVGSVLMFLSQFIRV